MQLNKAQRDATAKMMLDLAKLLPASFAIGALIPNSPIDAIRIVVATVIAAVLYVGSMWLLKGANHEPG